MGHFSTPEAEQKSCQSFNPENQGSDLLIVRTLIFGIQEFSGFVLTDLIKWVISALRRLNSNHVNPLILKIRVQTFSLSEP